MALQIYGIPTCGTCKKAFKWLEKDGVSYEFIDMKVQPPNRQTIAAWMDVLGSKPMRNTSGQSYRSLGEAKQTWTDAQWLDAFAQDAMLLKRPIFVQNDAAIGVGFKEEELREKLKP